MSGVSVEDRGGARWITLDRPDCRNALDPDVLGALRAGVDGAVAAGARAIVLVGRGGAFCSGADLRYAVAQGPALRDNLETHLGHFQDLVRAIVSSPLPSIAAVDGVAYGFGCDLALACDLRVVTSRAYFQEGFVRIGLIPDGGGTWMLPRLVGLSKALELTLLGEKLDAAAALHLGLVARVVAPDELDAAVTAVADKLVNGPPMAIAHIKRLVRAGLSKPFDEAFRDEGRAQAECLRSDDCVEGITAFFQKRPPAFSGR
jgi:enoyl-CoA hydratase/carnithine racemase